MLPDARRGTYRNLNKWLTVESKFTRVLTISLNLPSAKIFCKM